MYTHILIPTDGSDIAEKAVAAGIDYAREAGASVVFFTAMPEYVVPSEAELMSRRGTPLHDYERKAADAAQAILEKVAHMAKDAQVPFETDYVLNDHPSRAIIDAAKRHHCDAIFMSNIIHSENEETNAALMKKCARALATGGMLIVKDHVMNAELTEPQAGAVFALYLMLTTEGRDYSLDELSAWMRDAGLGAIEERRLPSPPFTSSIVIARKPR